jgi:hypothetical protein
MISTRFVYRGVLSLHSMLSWIIISTRFVYRGVLSVHSMFIVEYYQYSVCLSWILCTDNTPGYTNRVLIILHDKHTVYC